MAGQRRVTREAIIGNARRIIAKKGTAALTYQALAETLGVSKQAIIYWFPSKADLARELIVPALRDEAQAIIDALTGVRSAKRGIEVFLRALIAHHLADLGTFRLIYIVAQFDMQIWETAGQKAVTDPIHATTATMYGALEAVLRKAPDFADPSSARRVAVATHMAGVGLLTMLSLTEATHDPMAHTPDALIDTLVLIATGKVVKARRGRQPRAGQFAEARFSSVVTAKRVARRVRSPALVPTVRR